MAKLEYFLVAESVSVDQATNRVSIFNIIEEARFRRFPAPINQMIAVCLWNAEEGDADRDFQLGVRLTFPDGKTQDFQQNFRLTGPRLRTLCYLQGVPVRSPGLINVELTLNGEHKASHSIDVSQSED